MNGDLTTTARLQHGRLTIRGWDRVHARLRRQRDGEYIIHIRKAMATRSQRANAWYWGVIVQLLADHTGYTPDEMHDVLKAKFSPKRFAVADGNGEILDELVIGSSSSKLDSAQFSEYCEAIRQWAADVLHVVIPDPDGGG